MTGRLPGDASRSPLPESLVHAQILLYDGFDELDGLAPFEVLQAAAALGADLRSEVVTVDGNEEVIAAHGLRLQVQGKLGRSDVLVVPGGGWVAKAPRGARAEAGRGVIPSVIADCHREGTILAAVCTGAMLIATAGLLRGRSAITHHGAIEDLRAAGAEIVQARVVDDGNIITAGGVTSGLDLALWLVERFAGPGHAVATERQLEYERRGTVWRRPG